MIDISKARQELTEAEMVAVGWLDEHGCNGILATQGVYTTAFFVMWHGVIDKLIIMRNASIPSTMHYLNLYQEKMAWAQLIEEMLKGSKDNV